MKDGSKTKSTRTRGSYMGYNSLLRSPKKEEQQVPDATPSELDGTKGSYARGEIEIIDELDGLLGDENGELSRDKIDGHLSWDIMVWDTGLQHADEEDDEGDHKVYSAAKYLDEESEYNNKAVKTEQLGFWELDDEKRVSLNLNLNYQDVLDAWSDRGPLWADDCSISAATNVNGGEVPMMELEERTRREASVLRYKEKRQTRLFCKKIRYEVRKLNADKRPRLKGRFVKRVS
ncbi:protein CHLOROPLAST IMPORT APPARATUS 2-like isoform X2 [Hibiscus syriacus]|uniref:protein CHLOROPLAST IMPORT APPARATUS 2-like isoform X2 n=1 Tax=Hibiscus syriacus TaxID=106335 RepID=UPI001921303F|nr:protein CHLOROPLAST IMPORT APPARATUS 2-like isoform X2 [Hibiscus syriacus]